MEFTTATDKDALEALRFFARTEGIVFALESAHAGAAGMRIASECDKAVVINMSGRGDKDLFITARELAVDGWVDFLKAEADRCEGE